MRRSAALGLACALAVVLAACPPAAAPTTDDASDAAISADAEGVCANAKRIGCALGSLPSCVAAVKEGVRGQHTSIDVLVCASTAPSNAAFESCGVYFKGACASP